MYTSSTDVNKNLITGDAFAIFLLSAARGVFFNTTRKSKDHGFDEVNRPSGPYDPKVFPIFARRSYIKYPN